MWISALIGAIIGSIIIPILYEFGKKLVNWYKNSRPARKVFESIFDQGELCKIFIRDFFIDSGTKLYTYVPKEGNKIVPNIQELWADSDARAATNIFNVLGRIGKTKNIELRKNSQDFGEWNTNIIIIGAHASKSKEFFNIMDNVTYRIDAENIIDNISNEKIKREDGFGYGIIVKAKNPYKIGKKNGIGFLIGGFGTLGTEAATYYFRENYIKLGSEFGRKYFGIIVRAKASAGPDSVQRINKFDKVIKGS